LAELPADRLARALSSLLIDKGVLKAEEIAARAAQEKK